MSIFLLVCFSEDLYAQAGAGVKLGPQRQAYVDSIKNSDYKWTFPAWGKRITKKGFDIPYSAGVMLNTYVGSQEMTISDLKVGFNDMEPIPLDFVKFEKVNAKIQSVNIRPDIWLLPFLDIYAIGGASSARTEVNIVAPADFSTTADFKGTTLGFGTTLAGGFHGIIAIVDGNRTWTKMTNIEGSVVTSMLSIRLGYSFLFENKPWRSAALWMGTSGVFVNRTTEGSIETGDLTSTKASLPDLEGAANGTADWLNNLTPQQQTVIKRIAQDLINKINKLPTVETIRYSLIKKPTSNWSMCMGEQFQFSHRWQARTEVGFLGGRKSLMLSGNYRFRL